MCIHSWKEMLKFEKSVQDRYDRMLAKKIKEELKRNEARRAKHFIKAGINPLSTIIMRHPITGHFMEAYFCNVTDLQDIANVIRNLKAWHPHKMGHKIGLTKVNERREQMNLSAISLEVLPEPTGTAPPSEDPEVSVPELIKAQEKTKLYAYA